MYSLQGIFRNGDSKSRVSVRPRVLAIAPREVFQRIGFSPAASPHSEIRRCCYWCRCPLCCVSPSCNGCNTDQCREMSLHVAPAGVGHHLHCSWSQGLVDYAPPRLLRLGTARTSRGGTSHCTIAKRCPPCRKGRSRSVDIVRPARAMPA